MIATSGSVRFVMALLGLATATTLAPRPAYAGCSQTPFLCGLPVHSTIEQPQLDVAIDIVLVGDGFTTVGAWTAVAQSAINTIKAQTAPGIYSASLQLYNFHVVDVVSAGSDVENEDRTDTALGMKTSGPYIVSDGARVATAALNAPDADVVIAIGNGNGRANAHPATGLATGGDIRLGLDLSPMSHELGHALFGLADEYEEYDRCKSGPPSEAALLFDANVTVDPTCTKFSHLAGAGCVVGGHYCSAGVYRSAVGCLMRASGNAGTCPACAHEIKTTLLERRTGLDAAEPWLVVTGVPAPPNALGGVIRATVILNDHGFGPTRVSLTADDKYVGSGTVAATRYGSVSIDVDTRRLLDGTHVLRAYADDAAGRTRKSAPLSFVTQNHTPVSPATVSFTTPAAGATVSGLAYVSATVAATDPVPALLYVESDGVLVDGASGQRTASFQWDTTALTLGAHSLVATALYPSGAKFSSPPLSVTVAAPSGDPGPGGGGGSEGGGSNEQDARMHISAPASWSGVGPAFLLELGANGLGGATADVSVSVDGGAPVTIATGLVVGPYHNVTTALLVDSSAWSLGAHAVEVLVDSGTGHARSTPFVLVRQAPTGPVGFVYGLPEGYVRGTIPVQVAGYDDVAVTALELRVDGVLVGSVASASGSVAWNTTTSANTCHQLVVTARDGAGNSFTSAARSSCVDNAAPTVSISAPQTGATSGPFVWVALALADQGSSVIKTELLVDGTVARTLGYGSTALLALAPGSRTLVARATDMAGNVTSSSSVAVTVASCVASGCDDGNACTTDACAPDGCHNVRTPGCCQLATDCEDGDPCTTHTCESGVCASATTAGCCSFGFACPDGNPCTKDVCSGPGGTCSNPAGACCSSASDCADASSCTQDTCILGPGGLCAHDRPGDCCTQPSDCDDHDPCTADSCNTGTCSHAAVAGCCSSSEQCNDGELCTYDYCNLATNTCLTTPAYGCCESDQDCASLDPCITATCDTVKRTCVSSRAVNCCTFGFECGDSDPCTADSCASSTCSHTSVAVCCTVDLDCEDGNVCTAGTCDGAGTCSQSAIAGCCSDVSACDDGDPCTTDACELDHTCSHATMPACCLGDSDCGDGNTCTTDTCQANGCIYAPIPSCCVDASECNDGNPCTTDTCTTGACGHAAVAGCCTDAAQCADADATTSEECVSNACVVTTLAACGADADCDDGDECTTDHCAQSCVHSTVVGCGVPPEPPATEEPPPTEAPTVDELKRRTKVQGGCAAADPTGAWALLVLLALRSRRPKARLR